MSTSQPENASTRVDSRSRLEVPLSKSRQKWLESLHPCLRAMMQEEYRTNPVSRAVMESLTGDFDSPPPRRIKCPHAPEDPARHGELNPPFVMYVSWHSARKFAWNYFSEEIVYLQLAEGNSGHQGWLEAILGMQSVAKIAILTNTEEILDAHTNPAGLAYRIATRAIRGEHRHQKRRLTVGKSPARLPELPRPKLIYSGYAWRDGKRVPVYGYECRPSYDQTMEWPIYVEFVKIGTEDEAADANSDGHTSVVAESWLPGNEPDPESLTTDSNTRAIIEYAFDNYLTAREQKVMVLHACDEMSFREIGSLLGVTERTARNKWYRCLQVFKESLRLVPAKVLKVGPDGKLFRKFRKTFPKSPLVATNNYRRGKEKKCEASNCGKPRVLPGRVYSLPKEQAEAARVS